MTDATPVRLGAAAVLELVGADATAFAHSQFSSDVVGMAVGTWHMSAWLDAQGRARSLFLLLKPEAQRLLAWLPRGDAGAIARDLARFVFRAKVVLGASREWCFAQTSVEPVPDNGLLACGQGWHLQWPGTMRRSVILLPSDEAASEWPGADDETARHAWRVADIDAGLPWLEPEMAGICTAPSLDLERLAAVSTNKGCYPGQEIVARMHFRGGNKRHLWKIRMHGHEVPAPGSAIIDDASPALRGVLLCAEPLGADASIGLAVLPEPLDADAILRSESGVAVRAETREFTAQRPPSEGWPAPVET